MSRSPSRFDELPLLEKLGFIGAAAFHAAGRMADSISASATRVVKDSVAAFEREIDPNIEDAKVIEESEDDYRDLDPNAKKAAR